MLVHTAPRPDAITVPPVDAVTAPPPVDAATAPPPVDAVTALPPVDATTLPPTSADAARPAAAPAFRRPRMPTRISGLQAGLIGGALALAVLVIFMIQNAHVVQVSFLGIDVRLYMAVALLLTLIAGAVLMTLTAAALLLTAAGTARITQLRKAAGRALAPPPADAGPPAP